MNQGSLLVVDDDRPLLEAVADYLRSLGHHTETATTCDEAIARMKEYPFDAVICDVNLPDRDGFELLEWATKSVPDTQVILLTGFGTIDSAVEAIRLGAFDYLTKPIIDDELNFSIRRALGQKQIVTENKSLKQQLNQRFGMGNIVGHDYRMLKMFDLIESVADTRTTVLVLGESGTGKTMTARAIHQMSNRREKPFVEVACGALPDSLLESELVGHVAGAFTGATHDKMGKFMQANGGTIFLDEIGTASPNLQVKLLRVLQDREFESVGGNKTHKVDLRMILATNIDLEEAVRKGEFRQDLYYRINVVTLTQPPLRERMSDIPLLAAAFIKELSKDNGKQVNDLSPEALQLLLDHSWPGNVRELRAAIEHGVVMCNGNRITPRHLPASLKGEIFTSAGPRLLGAPAAPEDLDLGKMEARLIKRALEITHDNRTEAAKLLGLSRRTLQRKLLEMKGGAGAEA